MCIIILVGMCACVCVRVCMYMCRSWVGFCVKCVCVSLRFSVWRNVGTGCVSHESCTQVHLYFQFLRRKYGRACVFVSVKRVCVCV